MFVGAFDEPLEFADGMSQYRAYFALGKVDPSGTTIKANDEKSDSFLNPKTGCCVVALWFGTPGQASSAKGGKHAAINCSNGVYASFYPGSEFEDSEKDLTPDDTGTATTPPDEVIEICCLDLSKIKVRFGKQKRKCKFDGVGGYVCTSVVSELLYVGSNRDRTPECPCHFKPTGSIFNPNGGIPGIDSPGTLKNIANYLKKNDCSRVKCVPDLVNGCYSWRCFL